MAEDTPLDELPGISAAIRRATDPYLLAQKYKVTPLVAAIVELTAAARFLTMLGGATAAAETLRDTAGRVERGEFPEPLHPAGNA